MHEEASVWLYPSEGVPTRLAPLDEESDFWIKVEGTLVSKGEPRTVIQGLSGGGLDSLFDYEGGLQLQGSADLQDIKIMDSGAGIVVHEGAELILKRGVLDGLNEIGVGVFGRADVEESEIRNHSLIAVAGRATCDIAINATVIEAIRDGVVVNSCQATIRDSHIHNPGVGMTVTGSADVTLSHSIIADYRVDGIAASAQPGKTPPRIMIQDVKLVPGETGKRGIELLNAGTVQIEHLVVTDNELVGIQSSRTDRLTIANSTVSRNGGFGIHATGGLLDVHLHTMDFGDPEEETTNERGAIKHEVLIRVTGVGNDGQPLKGFNLEIRGSEGEPVFNRTSEQGAMLVSFPAYRQDGANPLFLGPFTYRATVPDQGVQEGKIDLASDELVIRFHRLQEAPSPAVLLIALAIAMLAGALRRWNATTRNFPIRENVTFTSTKYQKDKQVLHFPKRDLAEGDSDGPK